MIKLKKLLCLAFAIIITLNTLAPIYASAKNTKIEFLEPEYEHTFILTPDGDLIEITRSDQIIIPFSSEERIVLGSYILSRQQTKELADNMRMFNHPANTVAEFLVGLFGGAPGGVVALCYSLSRNATFNSDVIYAANHNKRIKITITDAKIHTSYSTQVKYTIVN